MSNTDFRRESRAAIGVSAQAGPAFLFEIKVIRAHRQMREAPQLLRRTIRALIGA